MEGGMAYDVCLILTFYFYIVTVRRIKMSASKLPSYIGSQHGQSQKKKSDFSSTVGGFEPQLLPIDRNCAPNL